MASRAHTPSEFVDQTIACSDCGHDFVWTAGEQEFFVQKRFNNPPKRCKPCRERKREGRDRDRQR